MTIHPPGPTRTAASPTVADKELAKAEDERLLDRIRTLAASEDADFAEVDALIRLYRARHSRRLIHQGLGGLVAGWKSLFRS